MTSWTRIGSAVKRAAAPGAARRESSLVEEAERLHYAQDAYSSAFTLAVFVIIASAFSLVAVPDLSRWPFGVLRAAEIAVAVVALVFFLATRGRPTVQGALFYSAVAILPFVAMVLPETAAWVRLGHPLNAFVVPQLLMACVALVVPRYFWLGAAVLALFTLQSLGVYVYLVHAGFRELRLSAEPFFSLIIALVGFSLLVMREQRRALAVKHVRAQSEVMALERIGPLFARVRAGLRVCVDALSSELPSLRPSPTGSATVVDRLKRTAGTLGALSGSLDQLALKAAASTLAEPRAAGVSFATADAERSLYARDAHIGATVLVTFLGVGAFLSLIVNPLGAQWKASRLLIALTLAACILVLADLLRRWRRPSERAALIMCVPLTLAIVPILALGQIQWVAAGRPFEPFFLAKVMILSLALVVGRKLWLGISFVLLFVIESMVLYWSLHMSAIRDRITVGEPWMTALFAVVGIAYLFVREQRRIASVQLLRAEATASALHRQAELLLALRDRINTPLQVLVTTSAMLRASREPLDRTAAATEHLVALSRELEQIQQEYPRSKQGLSFDALGILAPRS